MFGKPFFADMQLIQAKVFRPWPISTGHLNPWQWWMSLCIAPSFYLVFVQLELSMNLIARCQTLGKLQVLMRNMRFILHIATFGKWNQLEARNSHDLSFFRTPTSLWADAICSFFSSQGSRFFNTSQLATTSAPSTAWSSCTGCGTIGQRPPLLTCAPTTHLSVCFRTCGSLQNGYPECFHHNHLATISFPCLLYTEWTGGPYWNLPSNSVYKM